MLHIRSKLSRERSELITLAKQVNQESDQDESIEQGEPVLR